jgi:hypothetical protein
MTIRAEFETAESELRAAESKLQVAEREYFGAQSVYQIKRAAAAALARAVLAATPEDAGVKVT